VADEVSNRREKTPTAVADMIITTLKEFEERIDSSAHNLIHGVNRVRADLKENLMSVSKSLEVAARNRVLDNVHRLAALLKGLQYSRKLIKNEALKLRTSESSIKHLNPRNVLKRGYSITYSNGRAVKTGSDVNKGDSLRTVLYKGEITSRVERKKSS
jgi:exodeoxyribonuclease VII large subunit